jgi:hypothetical protein
MAEIAFVVKTFFVACVFIFLMQYQVKGVSAESQIFSLLQNNVVSGWLNDAGTGAVRLTASVADRVLPSQVKAVFNEKPQKREDIIKAQQEKMQKQEEQWVERVEKAVDGL